MDLKCPICLDPFQLPLCDIYCRHIFCFPCIKTWLRQKQSCPVCRRYFTKFVRITDEKLLKELDYLFVKCMYCNETNIRRGNFNDHIRYQCSKQIMIDHVKNKESLRQHFHLEYLLKRINESIASSRRQRQNYEPSHFTSLPLWTVLISSVHLFIYLSVFIPITTLLNITDFIIYLLRYTIIWLIRIIELRI
ncbi:unnamed protein product [Rotaria sordida]|uniref:RING-type domain-containing protein n=1 Tax=Rotaria sordida TaxID=392033 RepID=A0A815CQK9_9BILA|nr:unnamed protein product [Rotaria sordida]CAF1290883.1 unnamed protein product [Rotaria sordida]CAF1523365.1 unnamed protein product [Rotaria sordida]CAF3887096.1 unnamed protein product [Rotaria sordida]